MGPRNNALLLGAVALVSSAALLLLLRTRLRLHSEGARALRSPTDDVLTTMRPGCLDEETWAVARMMCDIDVDEAALCSVQEAGVATPSSSRECAELDAAAWVWTAEAGRKGELRGNIAVRGGSGEDTGGEVQCFAEAGMLAAVQCCVRPPRRLAARRA
jgi:hypothetical protein